MRKVYGPAVLVSVAMLLATAGARSDAPGEKSSPALDHLKQLEGTWEATIKAEGGPDIKGTMVYKMDIGGHWLVSRFKSETGFGTGPFSGMGLDSYDPAQKKYVSVWVDSMGNAPMVTHGDYDEATHSMTMTGKGPGPDGKMTNYKTVLKVDDKDHLTFTLAPADSDKPFMTIHYKRK